MVAMTLLVVTEPKPPTEWPRIEKAAVRPQVGVFRHVQGQRVIDADAEEVLAVVDHVLEDGDDVAGPHVAAAQAGRAVIDPRDAVDLLLAVLAGRWRRRTRP